MRRENKGTFLDGGSDRRFLIEGFWMPIYSVIPRPAFSRALHKMALPRIPERCLLSHTYSGPQFLCRVGPKVEGGSWCSLSSETHRPKHDWFEPIQLQGVGSHANLNTQSNQTQPRPLVLLRSVTGLDMANIGSPRVLRGSHGAVPLDFLIRRLHHHKKLDSHISLLQRPWLGKKNMAPAFGG